MDGSVLSEGRQGERAGKTVGEHKLNQWSNKGLLMNRWGYRL